MAFVGGIEAVGAAAGIGGALLTGESNDKMTDFFKKQIHQERRLFAAQFAQEEGHQLESMAQGQQIHADTQDAHLAAFNVSVAQYHQSEKTYRRAFEQQRLQHRVDCDITMHAEIREGLRDELDKENQKNNTLMLCNSVLLACSMSLISEGSLPVGTLSGTLVAYASLLGLSTGTLALSLWCSFLVNRRLNKYTAGALAQKERMGTRAGFLDSRWRDEVFFDAEKIRNDFKSWHGKFVLTMSTRAMQMLGLGVVTLFFATALLFHSKLRSMCDDVVGLAVNETVALPENLSDVFIEECRSGAHLHGAFVYMALAGLTVVLILLMELKERRSEKQKRGVYSKSQTIETSKKSSTDELLSRLRHFEENTREEERDIGRISSEFGEIGETWGKAEMEAQQRSFDEQMEHMRYRNLQMAEPSEPPEEPIDPCALEKMVQNIQRVSDTTRGLADQSYSKLQERLSQSLEGEYFSITKAAGGILDSNHMKHSQDNFSTDPDVSEAMARSAQMRSATEGHYRIYRDLAGGGSAAGGGSFSRASTAGSELSRSITAESGASAARTARAPPGRRKLLRDGTVLTVADDVFGALNQLVGAFARSTVVRIINKTDTLLKLIKAHNESGQFVTPADVEKFAKRNRTSEEVVNGLKLASKPPEFIEAWTSVIFGCKTKGMLGIGPSADVAGTVKYCTRGKDCEFKLCWNNPSWAGDDGRSAKGSEAKPVATEVPAAARLYGMRVDDDDQDENGSFHFTIFEQAAVSGVGPEAPAVLHEGFMDKNKPTGIGSLVGADRNMQWDTRYFILRTTAAGAVELAWFVSDADTRLHAQKNKIDLADVQNVVYPIPDKADNEFTIVVGQSKTKTAIGTRRPPYVLRAQTANEAVQWVSKLRGSVVSSDEEIEADQLRSVSSSLKDDDGGFAVLESASSAAQERRLAGRQSVSLQQMQTERMSAGAGVGGGQERGLDGRARP